MDLFVLHGVVEELKSEIVGGFITKIYQMNRTDLLLRIRRQGEEKQLLISTHPDSFRLHLTTRKQANPLVPPRFCTYLRKHILGAGIGEVLQDPYERVIRIFLKKRIDAGVTREIVLVVELLGKTSNVLLLEGDRILDCLHFRRVEEGAARAVLPGISYQALPPLEKYIIPGVTIERVEKILSPEGEERWKRLVRGISGLSPLLAQEIDFLSGPGAEDVWGKFRRIRDRYERGFFEPRIMTLPAGKRILTPWVLKSLGAVAEETFGSMNEAADAYYLETVSKRKITDQKQALTKRLRQLISRLQKRRENLLGDREKFAKEIDFKALGEILKAHYGELKKGMTEIEVADFRFDPPRPVVIPLDEALDPAGNVQRYFHRYKKAKRGLEFVQGRITETEKEATYLESALFQVQEAEDGEQVEIVRLELEREKIIIPPKRARALREKQEVSSPVRRLRSSKGLEIYCGKHNLGNDYLLRKLAKGNDLWFHAQGLPGSHVLLKVTSGEPPLDSILEAAAVAAYFSRGREANRVEVDYTLAQNVRRPKGARPGLVTYTHQRTVLVKPDKELVQKLLVP
jgi:predicted ribosome quality control (RQC) complex YloA/Tae2 family protein